MSDSLEVSVGTNPLLVDSDGDTNAADLLIGQRIALGLITSTVLELAHGDLYPPGAPDGVIDLQDLILLQQLVTAL